ncbi:MAG: PAS domain-containing protein [Anaerolineales bacterium]|uniref:chemotaxis protein CheB n=1 Tax=Candidatus Villigracilis vicinus TaxID=3140679 RepID=UPI0031368FA8|nr:PAS domain-containing protein [Anaerolineales bacterium]
MPNVSKPKASKEKKTNGKPVRRSVFPIVGIGASAGGLEALGVFLANVPEKSGLAFVIIQHLDPTHKGVMAELLQRETPMPVVQVKDRMKVKPDCVYIIPPDRDLSILNGALHLLEPVAPRGLRHPIDFFFRALADDQQERSIGVILSGMGSDGMLGLGAIKEKGGAVFVQDPLSAKFEGMPQSAIDAGVADVIAPIADLPGRILSYLRHPGLPVKPVGKIEEKLDSSLEKVVILLRAQTGHDFSLYKKTTIQRRIERRMGLHQITRIEMYVRFLRENPQELKILFQELLIGVTNFFRDPEAWEQLKKDILPKLIAGADTNRMLRAWVPACSTGEEAYSLAILFKEVLEQVKPARKITLQIFATDLDLNAIEKGREGIFPANIAADVSAKRLSRYFTKVDRGYQVVKAIREMIIFAPQNIIMDPPFTKLDLISCRNLLIYLTPELQKKLLPLFHYSLKPGGFLFLGNAETIGSFTHLFSPLTGKNRLYQRSASKLTSGLPEFPTAFSLLQADAPAKLPGLNNNLQSIAEELILQNYSPAAILTNEGGDILFINGRTGRYLEPASGKANWNIFVMVREGLRYGLTNAFQKAVHLKETVVLKNLEVDTAEGKQTVDITIQPIKGASHLKENVLIVFSDVLLKPKAVKAKSRGLHKDTERVMELEQDLDRALQETQSIREEMQTSQEELKSANEELQSTNEELQSTNEELTTSKEELQSINEEMHTVNQELQARLDELSHANNDLKNLLDSTDIATLFLDGNLRVRRFTSETGKITKLISGDIGRPITDIASALLYPELAEDALEVLRTLIKVEKQIPTQNGRWYAARILPYRTFENMIDGVVVTFSDITAYKKLEEELKKTEERPSFQSDPKE